ncbi:MAG: TIGR01244 family phosphatase [Nitratireductor sp.]|nr:TIGR01244 family phosphatase [Nitratireductor sp.]
MDFSNGVIRMDYRELDGALAVGPQIMPEDVATLAAKGIRMLVCNRPDGEEADQPEFAAIEAAAEGQGIATVYLPVTGQTMGPEVAARFREILDAADGPVFAYCRSGTRTTYLWSIGELLNGRAPAEVVALAGRAGYDVSALAQRFSSPG